MNHRICHKVWWIRSTCPQPPFCRSNVSRNNELLLHVDRNKMWIRLWACNPSFPKEKLSSKKPEPFHEYWALALVSKEFDTPFHVLANADKIEKYTHMPHALFQIAFLYRLKNSTFHHIKHLIHHLLGKIKFILIMLIKGCPMDACHFRQILYRNLLPFFLA